MASPPPMVALDSLDEQRQGLRVEFQWHQDRYVHTIYRVSGDIAVPLLSSLEGGEDEMFPLSPCLFELHQQEQILFLTGATSTCHWSLSVQTMQANSLVFEVACRLKTQAPWLGSKYKVLDPSAQKTLQSQSKIDSNGQQTHVSPAAEVPLTFPTTVQWDYVARA